MLRELWSSEGGRVTAPGEGGASGAPTTIKWSDGMAVLSYIGAQGRLLW